MNANRRVFLSGADTTLKKIAIVSVSCMVVFAATPAVADVCSALSSPIYQVINPTTQTSLLTASQNEATNAAQYGFTQNNGIPFYASLTPANGLVPAYRLYSPVTGDFMMTVNTNEVTSAVQNYGYENNGIRFYVAPSSSNCVQPVYRFYKNGIRRFTLNQADSALLASGWTLEGGAKFYAATTANNNNNNNNVPGGRPGPSNTGVPAGVKLTPFNDPNVQIMEGNTTAVIRTNGYVIDGKEIPYRLRIEAQNVVIKNSRILGGNEQPGANQSLVIVQPNASLKIQNSELFFKKGMEDGRSTYNLNGVTGQNFTLERVNIHHVIDQVTITGDNVVVRDSWLHSNLYYLHDPVQNYGPSHNDNIQIPMGRNIQITNNNMESTKNAAIMVTQDRGTVADLLIQNNRVGGGSCSFNFKSSRVLSNGLVIRNNTFTRTQVPSGCAMTMHPQTKANASITNNTWDNGSVVTIYNF